MSAILKIWDDYISPASNAGMDIGSSVLQFKDLWIDGVIYADEIQLDTAGKVQFRDVTIYIHSNTDGYLDLVADLGVRITKGIFQHALNIQTGTTYLITSNDEIVLLNHATDDVVVTLPAATGSGKVYYIKNINTGAVTVDGASSDTIDGELDILLANKYDSIIIVDGAANTWYILVDNR